MRARHVIVFSALTACVVGSLITLNGCLSSPPAGADADAGAGAGEAERGAPPADKSYVGRMQGFDGLIGIVLAGEEVLAYVCDAVEGATSHSGWFEGVLDGKDINLAAMVGTTYESTSLGATITGTRAGDEIRGVLMLGDGRSYAFSARPTDPDAAAGLFVDGNDELFSMVVVDNDGAARGLSRARATGWTRRVTLVARPRVTGEIEVRFLDPRGAPVQWTVPVRRQPHAVRRILSPLPDPLPTGGRGTLMILTELNNGRVIGHRYVKERTDTIGYPTIEITKKLSDVSRRPPSAVQQFMQARVLAESGRTISSQFIDDPLLPYLEVPADEDGDGMSWIRVDRQVRNFLVAVPNLSDARHVVFTRFGTSDRPIFAGSLDLKSKPIEKEMSRAQASSVYTTDDVEFDTIMFNGAINRYDLLILADGFTDSPADREKFSQEVYELLAFLWTVPEYEALRDRMNVHTAFIASYESGAGDSEQDPNDTPFQTFYNCEGLDRLICLTLPGRILAYVVAGRAPIGNYGAGSLDTIAILVNDDRYGGSGGSIATVSINNQSPRIFAHEFAHAVVDLADEYATPYSDVAVRAARLRANVSAEAGRADLKWNDLVAPETEIPTSSNFPVCHVESIEGCQPSDLPEGTVGMYEGAGYTNCGSYRPTTACIMRCLDTAYFCPVCSGEFEKTFRSYPLPATDVYLRDNWLDTGAVPSPSNVQPLGSPRSARPWQSPDIRVDAPPFGDFISRIGPQDHLIAGQTNRVYVRVLNRGGNLAAAPTTLKLYHAPASGGAPPFVGDNWTLIGEQIASVPGQGGESERIFEWAAPADLSPQTSLLVTADTPADRLPVVLTDDLTTLVRANNNIAWRNVQVGLPRINGEFSNYEKVIAPTLVHIDARDLPVGTLFHLEYETTIELEPHALDEVEQMTLQDTGAGSVSWQRTSPEQIEFAMVTELPAGAETEPFVAPFTLWVDLPDTTPAGQAYTIIITLWDFDPETGQIGLPRGGADYEIGFDGPG